MKKLSTVVGGLLFPLMTFATTITFDQALKETFQNNYELKAKKINVDIAKVEANKAKSYNFGNLWFEFNSIRTNEEAAKIASAYYHDRNFMTAKHYAPFVDIFNLRSILEFPIFTGFKISNAKKMAELQVKANKFKFARDKNKLAIEVLKAYNGVVAAKYFIEALQSAKKTTQSFVRMTQNLYNEGMIVKSDVLSAKAKDSEIDVKMIQAQNKFDLALAYLQFLTGDNKITDVKDFKVIISPNSKLDILQRDALNNRKDLKWMKANLDTMKLNVKMNKSVYYPQIGAHLEYGWRIDDDPKFSKYNDYYALAMQAKWYLLQAGASANVEEAKKKQLQTAFYLSQMKQGIKLDVKQKYLKLKAATAIIKAKEEAQITAHKILDEYENMYKNGLVNITILLMKQAEAQKADAELIKAKYDQAIAAAELKLAVGDMIQK